MNRFRALHDESGVAMIMALLGVVILAGLTVVFLSRATSETRAASFSQDFESALHVAEASADRRIADVAADGDYITTADDGSDFVLDDADVGNVDAEEAWILEQLDRARGSDAWASEVEGEAYAIRPRLASGEPAQAIYAASAVPGFDANRSRVRVLKLQIDQAHFVPEFAFLTNGSFDIGGNAAIVAPGCDPDAPDEELCFADVHTNQSYTSSGSSSTIHGVVTTSESTCPADSTAVFGCKADAQLHDIPEIHASAYYDIDADRTNTGQPVDWWDLCNDGWVRHGSETGPCTGEQEWLSTGGNTRFRGWRWQSSQNTWQADAVESGVYYVHHADASIQGSQGKEQHSVSVLVERDPSNLTESGSLSISGNPKMQAAVHNLLFLSDADLDMNGTATGGTCGETSSSYSGLIAVGEQFDTQGTVELRGSIIVQDLSDDHPLVRRNNASVAGTMCLEFDEELNFDLLGQWVITFWNEL
ncbi:MAG: hypothetical protein WD638_04650 [Nitriliruptoraceae bacterium]